MNGKTHESKHLCSVTVAHGAVGDEKSVTVSCQGAGRVALSHMTPDEARGVAEYLLEMADFGEGAAAEPPAVIDEEPAESPSVEA